MASEVVVVGGVDSYPALGAGLVAVSGLMKSSDTHGVGLKWLLDDIAVGVVEGAGKISLG